MTPTPKRPPFSDDAESNLRAMCQVALNADDFQALDDRTAPKFDNSVKTVFLKRTIARAVTPKAQKRVEGLRTLERLVAKQIERGWIGVEGHMLGSVVNAFPVSHRAIRRELRGHGVQNLVEAAEQIELRLWIAPKRERRRE